MWALEIGWGIIIVWQRFCEPARLKIAYCPWFRVSVCSISCPPPQIDKDVTSELAICVWSSSSPCPRNYLPCPQGLRGAYIIPALTVSNVLCCSARHLLHIYTSVTGGFWCHMTTARHLLLLKVLFIHILRFWESELVAAKNLANSLSI